jgi:hypothetical protein
VPGTFLRANGFHEGTIMHIKRLIALASFAVVAAAGAIVACETALAQTPVSAIFSGDRFAPGPMHDTAWIEAYGGWNASYVTLAGTTDSNYNLTNVKLAYTQLPGLIRFFDQPQDSAMNSTPTYDVYPGTAFFLPTWDTNAQFVAIKSLNANQIVAYSVDTLAKDRKWVLTNGHSPMVYENDSAGTIDSAYSAFIISWTQPYVDTTKGFHSSDIGLTVSRNYGDSVFAAGSDLSITPQMTANWGTNSGFSFTFASVASDSVLVASSYNSTTYKFGYKEEKFGPTLIGMGILNDTDWITQMADIQLKEVINGATNVIYPIMPNANGPVIGPYYLNDSLDASLSSRILQVNQDSAYHAADWFLDFTYMNMNGSTFQYDQNTSQAFGTVYFYLAYGNNGILNDTTVYLQFTPNGDHYSLVGQRFQIFDGNPLNGVLTGYATKFTTSDGLTMSTSTDGDTIAFSADPYGTYIAQNIAYAQQTPWEPTPLPQGVQLLLPPDSTKLTGSQSVRLVWTYSGTPVSDYHLHMASTSFALDSTLADTSASLTLDTGTYNWSVTAENSAGEGPVSEDFIFTIAALAGVELESEQVAGFGIFPNPLTQSTTISFTPKTSGYADVSIVNPLGVEIAHIFTGVVVAGNHSFTWNPAGDPDGMYECVMRMNEHVETLPIVLQR